eukprot:11092517-Alexandrium_andersonii.AAC.1
MARAARSAWASMSLANTWQCGQAAGTSSTCAASSGMRSRRRPPRAAFSAIARWMGQCRARLARASAVGQGSACAAALRASTVGGRALRA